MQTSTPPNPCNHPHAPKQPAAIETSTLMAAAPAVMEVAPSAPCASTSPETSAIAAAPGDSPEVEVATVRQLAQQHREAEATLRLQAFHRSYPPWSLPADPRALMGEP